LAFAFFSKTLARDPVLHINWHPKMKDVKMRTFFGVRAFISKKFHTQNVHISIIIKSICFQKNFLTPWQDLNQQFYVRLTDKMSKIHIAWAKDQILFDNFAIVIEFLALKCPKLMLIFMLKFLP
jgi:hypothetical protein